MKKFFFSVALALAAILPSAAQNALNDKGDSILGEYYLVQNGDESKVRFTKNADGTYKCQIFWLKNDKDASGKKYLDEKNPDKSLRSTPADQVVLINGLKYNAEKKQWDGAKIYDPQRGLKANVTAVFVSDKKLKLRGSVMGIGETVYWNKL